MPLTDTSPDVLEVADTTDTDGMTDERSPDGQDPEVSDGADVDASDDGTFPVDAVADSALDDEIADGDADTGVEVGPSGCNAGELAFVDLPEASGAVQLGADHDLIVADSGHSGRALILDRAHGAAVPLVLPLGDGAGDDIEGLSLGPRTEVPTLVWGLSSSGYLRAWRVERPEGAWTATLVHGAVAIGEPGEWVGRPNAVNAAGNFEGICLHPAPASGECAGWAASKARGELVCLRAEQDSFRLDPEVRLPVLEAEHLSDCAFEPDPPYRLFAAGNVYSGDRVIAVATDRTRAPTLAGLSGLAGAPNQEAILVRNLSGSLEIQSFGDLQDLAGDRSPRVVLSCRP